MGSAPQWFSRDPAAYAAFRPRYPPALFAWLAGLPARRDLAWDCGTGSGQAATMLAPHVARVIATDASLGQLRAARRAAAVHYAAATAEAAPLAGGRVDLVTVAQAFHWLDARRFAAEARRVAAPGAALAVWGYSRIEGEPRLQALLTRFHEVEMGPWWPAERQLVESRYAGLELPIAQEVTAPAFVIAAELRLHELLGYLGTWSAVVRFRNQEGRDPIAPLGPALAAVWGDPASARPFRWPIFVRAGTIAR